MSPFKHEIDNDNLEDRKDRHPDKEFRLSCLVVENDHAEESSQCAEAGGKTQKIALRDAEFVFFGLFLIGAKKGEGNEVHQNKEKEEENTVFKDKLTNMRQLVCHFYTPLTLYRE